MEEGTSNKPDTTKSSGQIDKINKEQHIKVQSMEFRRRQSNFDEKFQQKNVNKLSLPASKENLTNKLSSYPNLGARPKVRSVEHTREKKEKGNKRTDEGSLQHDIASGRRQVESDVDTNLTDSKSKKSRKSDESARSMGGQYQSQNQRNVDMKENISSKQEIGKGGRKMGTGKYAKKRGYKHVPITKQNEHCLYIILEEMTTRTSQLKEFLDYRMGSPGNLTFDVIKTELPDPKDTTHLVVLSFQSANKAAYGRSLLNRSNRNSRIKVHCFETENDAKGIMKDRTCDTQEAIASTLREAKKAFTTHDKKLETFENELKHVNEQLHARKGVSLANFQNLSEQKPALEDKQMELRKQRNEFVNYIQAMKPKILEVPNKDYDKQMKQIRIAFGAECRRLEAGLPMYACREEILTIVRENQVCVVLGETGSGKSTQMVQYLYQAGYAEKGQIVCTQPRKIAASSLAQRVASEMGGGVGQETGYKVGMQAKISTLTKILFVTDHILLNECLKDDNLSKYSCIIIDEAHERSIFTDLLLGMLKMCLGKRPELKVIVTSATIDPGVFVEYFKSICTCPVLQVSGRVFPVDVFYEEDDHDSQFPDNYESKAVNKAMDIHRNNPVEAGDILVFLTAPLETDKCCQKFQNTVKNNDHQCLPLHGRLTPEQQQLVFAAPTKGKRKIVFATNSAETSITIPGIRFVIDTGVCKEMQYDANKNISSLCVVPISQSSANQRKGRAGRVSVGSCYRLYKEADYDQMEKIGKPEILRIHLAQGLLKLMEIGVNPLSFEFVQSPAKTAIAAAIENLEEIEASKNGKITELGKWIAKLPVDPRLGALIKKGIDAGVPLETLVVAGYNNQKNVFFRVGSDEEKKKCDMLKIKFCHEMGDIFTALNVYRAWNEVNEGTKGQWCKKNSINGKSMKNIRDQVKEIITILQKEANIKIKYEFSTDENRDQTLHTLVFRSMMHNLCVYLGHEKAGYLTLKR